MKIRLCMREAWALLAVLICGCIPEDRPSQHPPPQNYGNVQQYPGQPPPQGGYPVQTPPPPPQPGNYPQPTTPTAPAPPIPNVNVTNDPINQTNIPFLRQRAGAVFSELVGNLTSNYKSRVATIPLVFDDDPTSVNAFAACTGSGKALIALTDGMLDIQAKLAQARATDEIFGTQKVGEYIAYVAKNQSPGAPVVQLPPGFFTQQQMYDPRKVSRQHEVYDEEVAFVLGHELAHHYLGHLPCTAAPGPLNTAEIGWALSNALPAFNQPNEIASDVAGVRNVLDSGKARNGYHWTESGGLLTMQFFAGLDQLSPTDILFGFEHSHPPPQLRTPIIQQTANGWRNTGGASFPFPLPF